MARKSPFRLLSIEFRKLSSPRSLDFFGNSHPKNEFTFVSKESHQTKIPTLIRFKKTKSKGVGCWRNVAYDSQLLSGSHGPGRARLGTAPSVTSQQPLTLFKNFTYNSTISRNTIEFLSDLCVYLSSNISAGFHVLYLVTGFYF